MNKNIYIFWTGSNKISQNRLNNIEQLKKQTCLNIIFITPDNLGEYILKTEPLHESYQYLSAVHKADYLRTYFMNFYGGGYSDIKKTRGNWIESFKLLYDSDKYINGYPELKPSDIAYKPLRKKWNKLIGNCAYICKKETPLTKEWYNEMIKLLDSKEVARRPLECFLYSVVSNDEHINKHSELLDNARSMGFNVPNYEKVVKGLDGVKKYIHYWDKNRHNLPFEIDGIVIKVNSCLLYTSDAADE